jgi:hypothetical protein
MLNLSATNPDRILERPIATGSTIAAEGVPLIRALERGKEHVKPSAGAAGEIFVGFSWAHNLVPSMISRVENATIPGGAPYTVQLSRNNLVAANILVVKASDGTALTEGNPANAGEYSCNDTTGLLTFNVAEAGIDIVVTYRYYPTTLEAKFNYPDPDVNINPAFEVLNQIGFIPGGEVYTDQFDAAVDWANQTDVYLGAGILAGSGNVKLPAGHRVVHVPTVDNPYLGIMFGY